LEKDNETNDEAHYVYHTSTASFLI